VSTKKLSAPQAALLAKLPEHFVLREHFTASGASKGGTIHKFALVAGGEAIVYRFTTGDSRAFRSLWIAGKLCAVGTPLHVRSNEPGATEAIEYVFTVSA
jgi:hypothetical protein